MDLAMAEPSSGNELKMQRTMKKSFLLLGLASVMTSFTACSTDDAEMTAGVPEEGLRLELKANVPGGDTRTQMGDNAAVWSADDRIALFVDGPFDHWLGFDLKEGAGTGSATFMTDPIYDDVWTSTEYLARSVPYAKSNQVVAIYPYENAVAEDPSGGGYASMAQIGALIPAEQTYVEGGFASGSLPMIAMTTRYSGTGSELDTFDPFRFQYLGGLLKFQIGAATATTLDRIEVVSLYNLADEVVVTFMPEYMDESVMTALEQGTGSLGTVGSASFSARSTIGRSSQTVTLTGPIALKGGEELTDAYVVVVPNDFGGTGMTIRFYKQGEDAPVVRSISMNEVKAGDLVTIAPLYLDEGTAPTLTLSDKTISWTDPGNVKEYTWTITEDTEVVARGSLEGSVTSFDLNSLDIQLGAGEHTLNFNMTVEFTDHLTSACAPLEFSLTALGFTPEVSYADGMITVRNWAELKSEENGNPTVEYASVNKADAGEADFASASFTEMNEATIDCSTLTPGDYTYMIRANYNGTYLSDFVTFHVADPSERALSAEFSYDYSSQILTITVTTGKDLCTPAFAGGYGYVNFNEGAWPTTITPVEGTEGTETWDPETGVIKIDVGAYIGYTTIEQGVEYEFSIILENPDSWGVIEEQSETYTITF